MKTLDRKFSRKEIKKDYSKVIGIYDFWSKLTETKALKKVMVFNGR